MQKINFITQFEKSEVNHKSDRRSNQDRRKFTSVPTLFK